MLHVAIIEGYFKMPLIVNIYVMQVMSKRTEEPVLGYLWIPH